MKIMCYMLSLLLSTIFSVPSHAWFVECPQDVVVKILQNDSITITRIQSQKAALDLEFLKAKEIVDNVAQKYGYKMFDDMDSDMMNGELPVSKDDQRLIDLFGKKKSSLQIRGEEHGLGNCAAIIDNQQDQKVEK